MPVQELLKHPFSLCAVDRNFQAENAYRWIVEQQGVEALHEQNILLYPNREYSISQLYDYYRDENEIFAEREAKFSQKIAEFSFPEQEFIKRALKIATVAHQFNYSLKDRYRKEKIAETGEMIPYILHPLEIAEKLVDDGFNWVIVAASLLHDVAEDAKLGEGLDTPEAWFFVLEREFSDSGKGELLVKYIRGATEKDLPERNTQEGQEIRDALRKTPMFNVIYTYLEDVAGKKMSSTAIAEAVFDVIYNLKHIIDAAFASPEETLPILILKIADIWQNFQTIEKVKPAKILRGRIAASLAEWMGWHIMRHRIVRELAQKTDTLSPYVSEIGLSIETPGKYREELTMLRQDSGAILKILFSKAGIKSEIPRIRMLWPLVHTDDKFSRWKETTLRVPEALVITPRQNLEALDRHSRDEEGKRMGFGWITFRSRPPKIYGARINDESYPVRVYLSNTFGRLRRDFWVKVGNQTAYQLRLESDEPYVIDFFKRNSKLKDFAACPEAKALFGNDLLNTPYWDNHLAGMLGFFYEPNAAVSKNQGNIAIFAKGSMFFFNGDISYRELYEALNMKLPPGDITIRASRASSEGLKNVSPETLLKDSWPRLLAGGKTLKSRLIFLS